jgi:hypothetical protein
MVTSLLYSDVSIHGFALTTSTTAPVALVDEGKIRALGSIETRVNVGGGLSYSGSIEVRGGEDVFGVGGRINARYQW